MDARTWLAEFAAAAGQPTPTDEQIDQLLKLAAVAAHSSERIAAPIACWVTASAGLDPAKALEIAEGIVPPDERPG